MGKNTKDAAANNTLNFVNVTAPMATTARTILVPTAAALPDVTALLPLRAIAQDTGVVYTIAGSWNAADVTE